MGHRVFHRWVRTGTQSLWESQFEWIFCDDASVVTETDDHTFLTLLSQVTHPCPLLTSFSSRVITVGPLTVLHTRDDHSGGPLTVLHTMDDTVTTTLDMNEIHHTHRPCGKKKIFPKKCAQWETFRKMKLLCRFPSLEVPSCDYLECVFICNWIKKRRETRVNNVTLKQRRVYKRSWTKVQV